MYRIVHTTQLKCYVGQSKGVRGRVTTHLRLLAMNRHSNKKLQNAWNKHGREAFAVECVQIVNEPETLLLVEKYFITHFDAVESGYNNMEDGLLPVSLCLPKRPATITAAELRTPRKRKR